MTGPLDLVGLELDVVGAHLDCCDGLEELGVYSLGHLVAHLGLHLVQLPGGVVQASHSSAVVRLTFRQGLDLTIGFVLRCFVETADALAFGTAGPSVGIFETDLVAQVHTLVLVEVDLQPSAEEVLFLEGHLEGRLQ